jgi:hypothetical protein
MAASRQCLRGRRRPHGAAELPAASRRGCPLSCYEDVLQAVLDAAGSPEDIDAAKNEHQLALQLRDLLESRRARQDALRALLECAKDLADVPDDVDTVLTSIVTRAQRLLGCDLAYLSLNDDERHGTYVRVMVGAIAAEWKDLLIPFGTGSAGWWLRQLPLS